MDIQYCAKCGQQNTMEAAFCSKCGQGLTGAQQAAAVASANLGVPQANPVQPPVQPGYTAVMEMDYPKAGFGSRFLAYIVDSIIGGLPLVPGLVLLGIDGMETLGGLLLFITGCWGFFYGFFKDGFTGGQSFGKKMNGLMVVSLSTNEPCSKGKSALRALSWCIPYIGGLIEIVMVLVTDKGRRLGDRFAGTQVIEVNQYKV